MHVTAAPNAHLRHAIAIVVVAMLGGAATADAGGRNLSGPTRVRLGERAAYELVVGGDPQTDACALTAQFSTAGSFRFADGVPGAQTVDRLLPRLDAGRLTTFTVAVVAPMTPGDGRLCATLTYRSCRTGAIATRLAPICLDLAAGAGRLPGLAVPCGTRATVTPGGGTFDPTEWADAATLAIGTSGTVTLHAKTNADSLFVALEVVDGTALDRRIKLLVNADDQAGPSAVDRAFEVTRTDVGTQFMGTATGFDAPMANTFAWEVDAPAGPSEPFTVELEIPLTAIGGPAVLQLGAIAVEGGPPASLEYWPAAFDGVDETLMQLSETSACFRRVVPCASPVTVERLGGAVDPAAWTDAATWQVRTPVLADLYAKVALGNLYFAAHLREPASAARITLYVNEDDSLGLPEVDDRAFRVIDGTAAELFGGSPTGYDVPLSPPVGFDYETQDLGAEHWVELEIPLAAIGAPISPSKFVKLAVRLGNLDEPWPTVWDLLTEDSMSDFELEDCACGVADFATGPGCVGEPTVFTDLSTNGPTTWSWDFGDGTPPDPTQNPTHTFASPGSYTVNLTSNGSGGCQTVSRVIDVFELPTVDLVITPTTQCVDATADAVFALDGTGSTAGTGGTIADPGGYGWGTTLGGLGGGSASSETLTLPAGTTGTANVTLTVTDSHGCADATTVQATAHPNPIIALVATPLAFCTDPSVAMTVGLDASGTSFAAGPATTWTWTVPAGHSTVGTGSVVTWTIPAGATGGFTATLDLTDDNFCMHTASVDIEIYELPVPDLVITPPAQCVNATTAAVFALDGSGSAAGSGATIADPGGYGWATTLGGVGGGSASTAVLTIPAGTTGTANVTLTVTDSHGCVDAVTVPAIANPDPIIALVASRVAFCTDPAAAMTVGLDAAATSFPGAPVSTWVWTLPAGHTLVGTGPVVGWSIPAGTTGLFTATLDVTDGNGCMHTADVDIEIYELPVPDLVITPPAQCVNATTAAVFALDGSGSAAGSGATIADPGGYGWATTLGGVGGGSASTAVLTIPAGTTGTANVTLTVTDSHGCVDAVTVPAIANPDPIIALVASRVAFCTDPAAAMTVGLDAAATSFPGAPVSTWVWTLPAGHTLVGTGPVVGWSIPAGTTGLFTATLDVTDGNGCMHTADVDIEIYELPVPDLVITPPAQCVNATTAAVFALDGSGSAAGSGATIADPGGYGWATTLGGVGGGSASTAVLTIPAGTTGTANVTLTVTDSHGCVDAVTVPAIANPDPIIALVASRVAFCTDPAAAMNVGLDASATSFPGAPVSTWVWTLPAGHTLVGTGPVVGWSIPAGTTGLFTATLDVTDGNGCMHTADVDIEIYELPVPDLVITPPAQCVNAATAAVFALDGSGSAAGSGATIADPGGYGWATTLGGVGGGSASTAVLTIPAGTTGTANVTLTVTDSHGCVDAVTVPAIANPDPIIALVASRVAFCTDPAAAMNVGLDASATSFPGAPVSTWVWTLPAGHTLVGTGPVVGWSIPAGTTGLFTATLDVTDGNGCMHTADVDIEIYELPVPDLVITPPAQCVNATTAAVFALDGSGSAAGSGATIADPGGYGWATTLGGVGGGSASTAVLTIPAGTTGTANVTLTVTDSHGCVDAVTVPAIANPDPIIALVASRVAFCTDPAAAMNVGLDASATSFPGAPVSTWVWTLPAGHTLVGTGPVVGWSIPAGTTGLFTATLDVTDGNGCMHTADVDIEIYELPVPDLVITPPAQCVNATTAAVFALDGSGSAAGSGATIADPGGYGWATTLGGVGGGSASTAVLTIPAGTTGTANVTLTVTDSHGCVDAVTVPAIANPDPIIALVASRVAFCTDPAAAMTVGLDASSTSFPGAPVSTWVWTLPAGHTLVGTGPVVGWSIPAGTTGLFTATLDVTDGNGCMHTADVDIEIYELPVPDLVITPPAQCVNATTAAVFALDGSGSAAGSGATIADPGGYGWATTLGGVGGGSASTAVLTIPAGTTGTANVTLTVTDSHGCVDAVTVPAIANPDPIIALVASRVAFCTDPAAAMNVGLDASATSFPGAPVSTWVWTLPAGHTLVGTGPVVGWSIPAGTTGLFTATLDVTDDNGCMHTADVDIEIYELPIPFILPFAPVVCTLPSDPPVVSFDSSISSATPPATIATHAWSITGPAAPASGAAPVFTTSYPPGTTGIQTATVTVNDSFGCQAATSANFELRDGAPPTAAMATLVTTICADPTTPTVLAFDASGSTASAPATLTNFTWWTSLGTLGGSGGAVETVTLAPGTYGLARVYVTVTDSAGCTAVVSTTVLVVGPPTPRFTAIPATVCEGPTGASVALEATTSTSQHPTDPTLIYGWTVSEGLLTPSGAVAPTLDIARLDVARDVTVTLDVIDAAGCPAVAPAIVLVHVDPSPTATMTVVPDVVGSPSLFTGAGIGGTPPLSYAWDFGDFGTGFGIATSHTYATAGTYVVTLTVTDSVGCSFVTTTTVAIDSNLAGSVSIGSACLGNPLDLIASIVGGTSPYTYAWDYGDGDTETTLTASTTHVYAATGDYPITLVVTDSAGSTLTLIGTASVLPLPTVTLTTSGPALVDAPQTFTAIGSVPAALVVWTFSDAGGATGTSVSHAFSTVGVVSATAIFTSSIGCSVEATIEVELVYGDTEVALAKGVTPAVTQPEGEVVYTVIVTNGRGPLAGIVLDDLLPNGLEYIAGTLTRDGLPLADPGDPRHLVLAPFTLSPFTTTTISYRVRVGAAVEAGTYLNSANLVARDASGDNLAVGPAVAALTVEPGVVDLRVRKRAFPEPAPPVPGGQIRYEIDYENVGARTATDVVVSDLLPRDHVTLQENTDLGILVGDTITWNIGEVPPGTQGLLRYSLRLADELPPNVTIRNTAVVTALEPEATPEDNRAIVDLATGGLPDLTVTKAVRTSPEPASDGAEATYTIDWANEGSSPATDVVIEDDYDESRIEITSSGGGSDTGGMLRFDIGDIDAGDRGTITYRARVLEGATEAVRNTAQIRSQFPDADPTNNTASAQFEIVRVAAELRLEGTIAPGRRCKRPQVQLALRGDTFDTAGAMYAAAEFLRVAGDLARAPRASHPTVDLAIVPPLIERLRAIGRSNVEQIFLHSAMGIPSADDSTIAIPYAFAHPVARASRLPGEPWCDHLEHRFTTPQALGYGLAAIAEYSFDAERAAHDLRGDALRRTAARLVGAGAHAVAILGQLDLAQELPSRWRISEPGTDPPLVLDGPRASLADLAVLADGLARIARVSRGGGDGADTAATASASAAMARVLFTELARRAELGPLGRDEPATATDVAAIADAVRAGRLSSGGAPPANLEGSLAARRAAHAGVDGGFTSSPPAATSNPETGRDIELAGMRAALAANDVAPARAAWNRLERNYLEPQLGIYRDSPDGRLIYGPAGLAAAVSALVGLAEQVDVDAERALLLARTNLLVRRIADDAGLQIEAGTRWTGKTTTILGSRGEIRVSSALPEEPGSLAPVLVNRVGFIGEHGRLRDAAVAEAASGVADAGTFVSYLTTDMRDTCETAVVRVADRRFTTASGLFAIDAMLTAAERLDPRGESPSDFGGALEANGFADAAAVGLLSGMGLKLANASGVDNLNELLETYARAAGLGQLPRPLDPVWLEFDAADPTPDAAIDEPSQTVIGWDPSKFDTTISPATVAQALLTDVRVVRLGLRSTDATARFVGLVRLHAATLKVERIQRELQSSGAVAGWRPVLDSAGRSIRMPPLERPPSLADNAALLDGVTGYAKLLGELGDSELARGVPTAPEAALNSAERLFALLQIQFPQVADASPLGQWHASRALATLAELLPDHASDARTLARESATVIDRGANGGDGSTLVRRALALELAATESRPDRVQELYSTLRDDLFDAGLGLFRPEPASTKQATFALTDLDAGAMLRGLSAAVPALAAEERQAALSLLETAGRRLLFDSGLERRAQLRSGIPGTRLPVAAPHLAHAIEIEIVDSSVTTASLYPGDIAHARFRLQNVVPGSLASDATLVIDLSPGVAYVPGSTRINGTRAGDAVVTGESTRLPLAQVVGGDEREVVFLVRASSDLTPGIYRWSARAEANATPGASTRLDTPAVGGVLQAERFGDVTGTIWLDEDADNARGPDELGVPGVTVMLDDGTACVTDRSGGYGFFDLLPARYRAFLLEESLPAPISIPDNYAMASFDLRAEGRARLDVAVAARDLATGFVFRDLNGNGQRDSGDPTVAGAVVETSGGRRSVSDRVGRYRLRDPAAGQNALRLPKLQPYLQDASMLRLQPTGAPADGR